MLVEAVQVVPGPCWTVLTVEVLVEAVQVLPGTLLDIIVSRSVSRGSTGSTSVSGGQNCQ